MWSGQYCLQQLSQCLVSCEQMNRSQVSHWYTQSLQTFSPFQQQRKTQSRQCKQGRWQTLHLGNLALKAPQPPHCLKPQSNNCCSRVSICAFCVWIWAFKLLISVLVDSGRVSLNTIASAWFTLSILFSVTLTLHNTANYCSASKMGVSHSCRVSWKLAWAK